MLGIHLLHKVKPQSSKENARGLLGMADINAQTISNKAMCQQIKYLEQSEYLRATGRLKRTLGAYFFCFLSLYFSYKHSKISFSPK